MAKCGEEYEPLHKILQDVEDLSHNLEDKSHDLALGINANPDELLVFMDQIEIHFRNARAEIIKHRKT